MMHNTGGGSVAGALMEILGITKIGGSSSTVGIGDDNFSQINDYMDAWGANTPYEMARRVRNFSEMSKWKMSEAYQCLIYHSVAIFSREEFVEMITGLHQDQTREVVEAYMHKVAAFHLIGGHTHEAPSKVCCDAIREAITYS